MNKLNDLTHFRHLPAEFVTTSLSDVQAFMDSLVAQNIDSEESLIEMMERYSDLLRAVYDEHNLRLLHMKIERYRQEAQDACIEFKLNYTDPVRSLASVLEKKYYDSEYRKNLTEGKYSHLDQLIANKYEISCQKNTPMLKKEQELALEYNNIGDILDVQTVLSTEPYPQEDSNLLATNRIHRELFWVSQNGTLLVAEQTLNDLFHKLCITRNTIAVNAGFANYRDYRHAELGRLAYTPDELISFHTAIEKEVMPFIEEIYEERVEKYELGSLRPWDIVENPNVDLLDAIESTDELVAKTVEVLDKIDPGFAQHLQMISDMCLLDFYGSDDKKHPASSSPLWGSGTGIIHMVRQWSHLDISNFIHECGHIIHFRAMRDIPLFIYQDAPDEVAELASLSMVLLSMDHWDIFYPDPADLKIAKRNELERALLTLPLFATLDAFQHWAYTHPEHSAEERRESYLDISARFSPYVDWSGLEAYQPQGWMDWQVFQQPFHDVYYSIAQLGALGVYMNYRKNKEKALQDFQNFLAAGYSKPVNELYQIAGIELDFSEAGLREIINFVKQELAAL